MLRNLGSRIWNPLLGKPRFEYHARINRNHSLNQGLLYEWLFNNKGVLLYEYARGSNAVITGATWQNTAKGEALNFSNDVGNYAHPNNTVLMNGLKVFSISCWVFLNAVNTNQMIFHRGSFYYYNGCMEFTLNANYPAFWMKVQDASTLSGVEYTAPNTSANRWYHCVLVIGASNIVMYVDAVPGTPTSYNGCYALTNDGGTFSNRFNIGKHEYMDETGTWPFNGKLAGISIYNRVLTAAEIRELFIHPYGTWNNPRLLVEPRKSYFIPSGVVLLDVNPVDDMEWD